MKRFFAATGLILAGVFVLGLISFAPMGVSWGHGPGGGDDGGHGKDGRGPVHFDSSAVQTITGKVAAYETVGGFGPQRMKALTVESGGKTLIIMLGPEFYLADEKLSLKEGDEVTVEASPAGSRTKAFFVAKSITAKGKTLALRDDAGIPLWRGQVRSAGSGDCPGCGMMGRGMMGGGMMGPARMLPQGQ